MNFFKDIMGKIGYSKNLPEENATKNNALFDQPFYEDITQARLKHLETLGILVKEKSVIDVGCGIGRLSEFFSSQNCDVFCVDGREENINELQKNYPGRKAAVVDLETNQLLNYGKFDIVFCYGLLYHLSDPYGFIKNAYKICNELMLIETCITDAEEPVVHLVSEDYNNPTQALHNIGCRPSPAYVIACLKLSGFSYVYRPKRLPDHVQFKYNRQNDYKHLRNGNLMRDIFIASHEEIKNDNLYKCD